MSFSTALSGLNAAQSDLSITSNNIANVATTGFKQSRAEFADIYSAGSLGTAATAIGSGVLLSRVAQQFTQGNLQFTRNSLDMAISGEGFFVLSDSISSNELLYTRAGAFGVDANGNVVNSAGQALRVFPVNPDGTVTATSLSSTVPLQVPNTAGAPTPTSMIDIGVNLPSNASTLDPLAFDPNSPVTYNSSTSVTIYDSLGEPHVATMYYVKTAPNTWAQYIYVDGNAVDVAGGTAGAGGQLYATLTFNNVGAFVGESPSPIQTAALGFTNGSDPAQTLVIDYANNSPTQFASPFAVNTLRQDGFPIGRLTGLDISESGVVRANYSNGQQLALGKIALARFANNQGLQQIGNTVWRETIDSGVALPGEAGTSSFGIIRGGALENSNVDLTQELVDLITAQRNFQANAKSIETFNSVTQTVIQIR
ncbi:MAG: flagellar hook protein FlgE [Gammaproteobacteria bacterium]|nr:MAG: flagellar hook protein FlgE [Gammaproteobacteria bacterium]